MQSINESISHSSQTFVCDRVRVRWVRDEKKGKQKGEKDSIRADALSLLRGYHLKFMPSTPLYA